MRIQNDRLRRSTACFRWWTNAARGGGRLVFMAGIFLASMHLGATGQAQTVAGEPSHREIDPEVAPAVDDTPGLSSELDFQHWLMPEKIGSTLQTILFVAILSLAPAILMMTTSFVRIVVVLSILRQAVGAQQLPSTQIITALALFMTFLIMTPVWNEVKNEALLPYANSGGQMSLEDAWQKGSRPVKQFMTRQIDVSGNIDDIWLFYNYLPDDQRQSKPASYDDIPIQVLLPAFVISELKIAFLIGFQIFMPFLVIDLVVTSIATSMGMVMLPPAMVSLPLKLMLFVLTDGWHLIVGMLMQSFAPYT